MSMDVEVSAPAESEAPEEMAVEAMDADAESEAAFALLMLSGAMPPCDGFEVASGDDGSLVVTCKGGESDGKAYAVSAAALEAAAAEIASMDAGEGEDAGEEPEME
jgi:hypothetical protein